MSLARHGCSLVNIRVSFSVVSSRWISSQILPGISRCGTMSPRLILVSLGPRGQCPFGQMPGLRGRRPAFTLLRNTKVNNRMVLLFPSAMFGVYSVERPAKSGNGTRGYVTLDREPMLWKGGVAAAEGKCARAHASFGRSRAEPLPYD